MRFVSIILSILILSILVIVHEFGHFLLARKNGIFVKEFSIGFGPRIISRESKSGTRFSWKAIPFGGSCTMLGALEDEDDETDDERSFDKKSVWARMSVILAGPIFNFVLAFILAVIYTATLGYDPAVVTQVVENTPAYEAGLRDGDLITRYDGTRISFGREIYLENYIKPVSERTDGVDITFKRDGKKYDVSIIPEEYEYYSIGISYRADEEPAKLAEVAAGSAFEEAGIKTGDIITAINGISIATGEELGKFFNENVLGPEPLKIDFSRRGGYMSANVTPKSQKAYRLGFSYNRKNVKTGAIGVLKYSFAELTFEIKSVYKSIGMLVSGRGSLDMLSGPVGIVEVISDTYTASAGSGFLITLMNILSIMILLSANLGVINLLPIPALDGGKFVLLIIEAITRRPVPKKVEGIVTIIGAGLLVVLMVAVLVNDVTNLF
ncbi:MAG: RIP metalloprotease RseP [Lachnospiraceae bacterium]|jgi:regulator of sigma E protease